MKIIRDIHEMQNFSKKIRAQYPSQKISFVPTMGFLHEGHRSLMRLAKKESDYLVVSIFVNPTQFNNPKDLEKYPRNEEQDLQICKNENVDVVFLPTATQVYPTKENYSQEKIILDYPKLTSQLCGKFRPGHFSGVLWVVHNLLLWVQPHSAFFGLKDYQQFILIRQMVFDLSLSVKICAGKLIRQQDGLALSSRNARLSAQGKKTALKISQSLFSVKEEMEKKNLNKKEAMQVWQSFFSGLKIEYADIYHPTTLQPLPLQSHPSQTKHGYLLAMAAYVEGVRLIDNILVEGEFFSF